MEEQKKEGEVTEEVKEVAAEVTPEVKDDRPAENYRAEIERKNREIERLRAERAERDSKPKYDVNDITTWDDNSLKLLRNSASPEHTQYKEQANDILLERKVRAIQAREYEARRKDELDAKLKETYPEAADPDSDFSMKMDKVMKEYDLHKTPAGRLAAAKIVAAETKTVAGKAGDKESKRVAAVKGQMVDGDRPKLTEVEGKTKTKELEDQLTSGKENRQVDAISQILKDRGMDRANFFKR